MNRALLPAARILPHAFPLLCSHLEAVHRQPPPGLLVAVVQVGDARVVHVLLLLPQEVSGHGVQAEGRAQGEGAGKESRHGKGRKEKGEGTLCPKEGRNGISEGGRGGHIREREGVAKGGDSLVYREGRIKGRGTLRVLCQAVPICSSPPPPFHRQLPSRPRSPNRPCPPCPLVSLHCLAPCPLPPPPPSPPPSHL